MNLQLFNKTKKILLFGGSFDPIHNGHIIILEAAINQIKPDGILLIPSFISPGKSLPNVTNEDKLEMIKIATKHIKNLEIIDYELNKKTTTYFIETIRYLKQTEHDGDYYLLIGEDQLHNLENWKEYNSIIEYIHQIYVYKRKHEFNQCLRCSSILKKYSNIKYLDNSNLIDISSSRIRNELVLDTDLNNEVLDYINTNGLYALNRIKKFCQEKRVSHSLSVAYYASEIMLIYDRSLVKKAFVAGIYHDIAKNIDSNEQIKIAQELKIENYPSWKVLHPYIGSYFLTSKYLFKDKDILDAISRHTLPFLYYDNKPTLLDKVIYVADKLEPNRTDNDIFNNVPISYFRDLAKKDINKCFEELYKNLQEGMR